MTNTYRVHIGSFAVDYSYDHTVSQQNALNYIAAELQAAVQSIGTSSFNTPKLVTQMLKRATNGALAEATTAGNFVNQLRLTIANWTYQLGVYDANGITQIWRGNLSYFRAQEFVKTKPDFNSLKNRVVRFGYQGGSQPGATRLVKVKSVEGNMLHAHDLVKNEHRQFVLEKITGVQEVTV